MIWLYSEIVKNKLINLFDQYDPPTYNKYYLSGLAYIVPMIKSFAETVSGEFIDRLFFKLEESCESIEKLVKKGELEIILYSSNTQFKLKNTQGFLIYTKTTHSVTKEEKIYVLLLCVEKPYRKFGYGKIFMEEFIERVKNSNDKPKRIILHSLDSSLGFYQAFGFTEIPDKPTNYKKIFKYEKYDANTVLMHLKI